MEKHRTVADSAFISKTAYVVGDVEIGENSSVWPGAVIRCDKGKIIIGKNTNIQDNSVVHDNITIGDNVHVGHGAIINCRKIGNHVLIGMNATLLHGAEIGNFCIIGAGCVVTREMIIPDKSFVVGIPAQIKGEASPQQIFRWTEAGPEGYAALSKNTKTRVYNRKGN